MSQYFLRIKDKKIVEMIDHSGKPMAYNSDLMPVTKEEYELAKAVKGDMRSLSRKAFALRYAVEHFEDVL